MLFVDINELIVVVLGHVYMWNSCIGSSVNDYFAVNLICNCDSMQQHVCDIVNTCSLWLHAVDKVCVSIICL